MSQLQKVLISHPIVLPSLRWGTAFPSTPFDRACARASRAPPRRSLWWAVHCGPRGFPLKARARCAVVFTMTVPLHTRVSPRGIASPSLLCWTGSSRTVLNPGCSVHSPPAAGQRFAAQLSAQQACGCFAGGAPSEKGYPKGASGIPKVRPCVTNGRGGMVG